MPPTAATLTPTPKQTPEIGNSPAPVPISHTANPTAPTATMSVASIPSKTEDPPLTAFPSIKNNQTLPAPKPAFTSVQWQATRNKIIAAVASVSFATALYRWLTSKQDTPHYTENVLINNTGSNIFVRGSDEPIAQNTTFALPASDTLWIKLDKDQANTQDLKIDMTTYAATDLQDSYLNLTIQKRWFSKWFTVPLVSSTRWAKKE